MKKVFNIEYSFSQFFFWGTYCAVTSFASAFLLSKGYSNTAIGTIVSIYCMLSIFIGPTIATVCDNNKKLTIMQVISFCLAASCCLLAIALFVKGTSIIVSIAYCLGAAIINSLVSHTNSLCFKLSETGYEVNYGVGRSIGSLGYSLTSLVAGFIILAFGGNSIIVCAIVIAVLYIIVLSFANKHYRAVSSATLSSTDEETISTKDFVKNNKRLILLSLLVASCFFMSNISNTYLLQIITPIGGTSKDLGIILSVMAVLEIPMFFMFDKIVKKFETEKLIIFGAINCIIKASFYFSKSLFFFYISQVFQMTSFAILEPSFVNYIHMHTSKTEAVRGQSIYCAFGCLCSIIASFVGGVILDNYGIKTLLIIGMSVALIGVSTLTILIKKK